MIQEGNECARTLLIVLSLALYAEVSEKNFSISGFNTGFWTNEESAQSKSQNYISVIALISRKQNSGQQH